MSFIILGVSQYTAGSKKDGNKHRRTVQYYDTQSRTITFVNDISIHESFDSVAARVPGFQISTAAQPNNQMFRVGNGVVDSGDFVDGVRPAGTYLDSYCTGTTLSVVKMKAVSWPNGLTIANALDITTSTDSVACGFVSTDLNIVDIIQTPSGADMSVQIVATGTFQPFSYSLDGITYQSSDTFIINESGSYIAYVKNTTGFVKSQSFIVNLEVYGLKYLGRFGNLTGNIYEAEIYKFQYGGSVSEMLMSGQPATREYKTQGDDKFTQIKGITLTLGVISESNFQYGELFSNDWKTFRLDYWKTLFVNAEFLSLDKWMQPIGDGGIEWPVVAGLYDVSIPASGHTKIIGQQVRSVSALDRFRIKTTINNFSDNSSTVYVSFINTDTSDRYDVSVYFGNDNLIEINELIELPINNLTYNFVGLFVENNSIGASEYRIISLFLQEPLFTGFIAPESYTEPYLPPPYEIKIAFTDCLGVIKDIPFNQPNGNLFFGKKKVLDVIRTCLVNTGLKLSILSSPGYVYDILPGYDGGSVVSTSYFDPLIFLEVKTEAFITDKLEAMNCYDVLVEVLKIIGCRMFQERGSWVIESIWIKKYETIYTHKYTFGGVRTGTVNLEHRVSFTGPDDYPLIRFQDQSQTMELKQAWASVTVKQNTKNSGEFILNPTGEIIEVTSDKPALITDANNILQKGVIVIQNKSVNTIRIIGDGVEDGWAEYVQMQAASIDVLFNGQTVLIPGLPSGIKTMQLKLKFEIVCASGTAQIKIEIQVGPKWIVSGGTIGGSNSLFFSDTQEFLTGTFNSNETIESNHVVNGTTPVGPVRVKVYRAKATTSGSIAAYNNTFTYIGGTAYTVLYNGNKFLFISPTDKMGVAPDTDITSWQQLSSEYVEYIDFQLISLTAVPSSALPEDTTDFTITNSGRYTFKPSDVAMIFGDGLTTFPISYDTMPGALTILEFNDVDDTLYESPSMSKWHAEGLSGAASIGSLISSIMLTLNKNPTQLIKGTLFTTFHLFFTDIIIDPNNAGKIFMINAATYDDRSNNMAIEFIELLTGNPDNYRLLEDGSYRLLEDGSYRLLEG